MTSEAKLFTDHSKCHVRIGYKKLSDFLADFVWLRGGGGGGQDKSAKNSPYPEKIASFQSCKEHFDGMEII